MKRFTLLLIASFLVSAAGIAQAVETQPARNGNSLQTQIPTSAIHMAKAGHTKKHAKKHHVKKHHAKAHTA